ncbi:hypothetical protein ACP4OV_023171 [Aristida adscensionis]
MLHCFTSDHPRMGTKVEHKNYLPGYTDMADSSVNSNGNLLRCQEIKPNRHLGDKFTIVSADGSVHYDKEMLKRTMLEHDATFRKQVYELHRLYKTQNDLMGQSQREYFNSHPSCLDTSQPMSYSSRAPAVDVKRVWQAGVTISRHDLKHPSGDLINKTGSQYSANGAPLNPNNVRSSRKMLDLELPAHIYADDDDEVEILDKKPSKSLPWTSSSVLGGNVKLNLGNSDGSSQVEKSWSTDIQPRHSSVTHLLDKPSEESSSMRKPDFLGVEVSTAQNQHYLSRGMNTRILEGNLKEQSTGKLSVASKEIRHNNSFGCKMDELSSSMAWLKYKQNVVDSSTGHYMFSPYTFNHSIIARPGFTDLLTSPWPGNNTSYTSKSLHDTGETSIANNILSSGVSKDSTQNTQHHSLKIHGELHHQKHPPPQDFVKDINLNDAPPDTTQDDAANWDQGSRNSLVDISWLKRKPVDLMETGVPLNAKATGSAMEKYSECSSAPHSATDIAPCIKHEADTEMLSEDTVAHPNKRIVIDLNEALPFMDDWEMDVCEPECDTEEHDDPSRDSLAITAAEGLLAMCNHVFPPGSPQADTLHWFADLAISKENTMFDKNSDDDFEALTLKLQETKSYEYHPAPRAQEVANNDARCSAASLLRTRPWRGRGRGRGRGRRQKKEFQKDVLPAIASLPKHEVSEDLRTLGRSTPATPTKGGGRNGQQAKGRRRPRTMTVTTEEAMAVSPAPVSPPLVPADLDADVLGVTRWGRTTRRCRRPRCPPANIASLRVA